MDSLLYDVDKLRLLCGPGGRVIFITFCRATGIMLRRLMEVSGARDMSGIVFVAFPFGDNISRAGGPDEIEAHFNLTGQRVPPHVSADISGEVC
jgi:hypothetical protein